MKDKLIDLLKNETVFAISGLAVMLSALFVPPSYQYISYIDFKVIALLFALMAVVAGFRSIGTFEVLSQTLLKHGSSVKVVSLILIMICFFTSMFVTNDVALLTMVPFTLAVLDFLSEKRIVFIVVMETVAANFGSMLTPVGNPQNLYLFAYFHLKVGEFIGITLPITILSLVLIVILTLAAKGQKMSIIFDVEVHIENKKKGFLFSFLFLVCMATVGGILDFRVMLIIVMLVVALVDVKLLKEVDFFLLLTFVFFFVFVGNIGQIEAVRTGISSMIEGREFLAAIGLSQMISNVPAGVMLSSFTADYKALILGTNIGGMGTLIASLASLISFKLYAQRKNAARIYYLGIFTAINLFFLIVLAVGGLLLL